MAWLQLSVIVSGEQAERTTDTLESLGSQATTQQNAGEDSYFDLAHPAEPKWDKQCITGLFEDNNNADTLVAEFMDSVDFITDIEVTHLEDMDWETAWLDQYQPIKITDDFWVYPSWVEPDENIETVIKIDPGLAFGTGTHETTHLCMKALREQTVDGKTVLDYGCGSGVLAITALVSGAKMAVGVDIDPKAERVSQENARINGVGERFAIQSAEQVLDRKFDVVVANILAFALIDLAPKLIDNADIGSSIILSGILDHQAADVIKAYQPHFKIETYTKDHWVVLLGHYYA